MIKKYILTFFLVLVQAVVFGATITSTATGGLWSSGSSWVGGVVPVSSDDVIIPSGSTVIVNEDAFAKSITVSGILTINHGKTLTVYGKVDVVSGGQFNAGTGNSDTAIIKVYGNFTNSGTANFWKSTVVIAGDLVTGSTILQNNGEIIVGGNVSAIISGGGNGYVYPVNPNVTVSVTGTSNAQVAGTLPTDSGLLILMYEVIYGGICPFAINDIASVTTCSGSNAVFTVSTSGSSPAYQWQVNTSGSGWVDLSNSALYSGVSTASLTITGVTVAMNSYKYRAKITSASCSKSGNYGILTVNPSPVITTQPITQLDCEGASVNFAAVATGTGLTYTWQRKKPTDESFITIPVEGNVSYPSVGKIKIDNIGSSQSPSGTQYQVVVTNSSGCSVNSSTAILLVNEIIGVTGSTTVTQCYGTSYSYSVTTSTPSPGYVVSYQWKSSVTSGVWNNVVDGTHFSGAKTATLNILNGTPTESAEYRVYVVFHSSGADCNVDSSTRSRTITFLSEVAAPVATITQPDCVTATASLVLSGLPASGTWTLTRTGTSNATTTGTGTSTTISGLATGTYNFTVSDGICTSLSSANVGINAQPATPTAPAVSITQPTCTLSTGTISVTVQDIGETYSFDNGVTFQPGNSKSGLASGNYDVIIKSNGGCDSPATNATIKNATNIWNGSAWSNGTLPISTENIEFNGNYPPVPNLNVDISGCSCTISSGTNVTIKSGHNLIITNEVSVLGTGTLTFENSASLVQINNVPNSGNIKYVRTTNTAVLSTDYTYWSSPVSPQTIGYFSPKTQEGMMYSYDSSVDDWKQEYLSTSMVAGLGYIVRGPEPSAVPTPPSPYMATFEGVPHNGDYSIPAIADKSYLLGNPYPSALDADTFLAANANVLNGTLYFWTHNTGIGTNVSNPGTGVYAYSGDDYATYNATGGVGAAPPDLDSTTGSAPSDPGHPVPPSLVDNGKIPTGKIAAGQGFFASTKTSISGSSIVYNNNMRVGVGGITGTNSQFFKTRNPKEKTTSTIQKNRVWLNLTNTQGAFKQTLVGYITDATNDYDSRFDGESFDGNEFVDFYSINEDKNLAIQGRALPFDENDEVPLGFRTTINGTFSINIDQVDGLLANQQVFIEDKLTNTLSDLKSGNYTFTTAPGTFNDRFVLRYKDNTSDKILSVDETKANDGIVVIYSNNYKTLIIRNNLPDAIVNSITLFNMLGQKITHWDIKERDQTSIQIPIKNVIPEIYIVKVKTTKGETSKRIIIR